MTFTKIVKRVYNYNSRHTQRDATGTSKTAKPIIVQQQKIESSWYNEGTLIFSKWHTSKTIFWVVVLVLAPNRCWKIITLSRFYLALEKEMEAKPESCPHGLIFFLAQDNIFLKTWGPSIGSKLAECWQEEI